MNGKTGIFVIVFSWRTGPLMHSHSSLSLTLEEEWLFSDRNVMLSLMFRQELPTGPDRSSQIDKVEQPQEEVAGGRLFLPSDAIATRPLI